MLAYANQIGLASYTVSKLNSWMVSWNSTGSWQVLFHSRYEKSEWDLVILTAMVRQVSFPFQEHLSKTN